MTNQYIITDAKITTLAQNSIVTVDDLLEEMNELYSDNPDFNVLTDSDFLSVELAEVTDFINNETSCVIEHKKERITVASLLL